MLALIMTVHVAGVVAWAAGFAVAARLLSLRAAGELFSPALEGLERDALFKAAHGGMAAAILSGAAMLSFNPSYFLGEGWMHAKLALALLAVAATVALTVLRKRGAASAGAVGRWRALFGLCLAGVLLLVFLRPF